MLHFLISGGLIAASIGPGAPITKVGALPKETVHLTKEMIIGISDDLMKADIAEVDIDPAVFDLPPAKTRKKSSVEEVEFVSEADRLQEKTLK